MKTFNRNILIKSTAIIALMIVSVFANAQQETLASIQTNNDPKVKVEIFPNPTADFLTIDLSKLDLKKPNIEIRNIIGSKMLMTKEDAGDKKIRVDVTSYPRGYYLVLVKDDQSKFQQTIRFSKK
uniref:T9SS type A sorting domain-containing protein n=1 Tax=Roseivirga sp. TaxID=1964215 RepID=UPI004048A36C